MVTIDSMRFPVRHDLSHAEGYSCASGRRRGRLAVTVFALLGIVTVGATATLTRGEQGVSSGDKEAGITAAGSFVSQPHEASRQPAQQAEEDSAATEALASTLERVAPQTMTEVYATTTLTVLDFVQSLEQATREKLFSNNLGVGQLGEQQKAALLRVARAMLGDAAFAALAEGLQRSPNAYRVGFSGEPEVSTPWSIRISGPEFQAQATVDPQDQTVFTVPVRAALPAQLTPEGPMPSTSLAKFYGAAFAFYGSLDEEQRAQVYAAPDPEASPCLSNVHCAPPEVAGVTAADLNDAQLHLLGQLLAEGGSLADPGAVIDAVDEESMTELSDVAVEWSGAQDFDTEEGSGIGLRIATPASYFELASDSWADARSVYLDR